MSKIQLFSLILKTMSSVKHILIVYPHWHLVVKLCISLPLQDEKTESGKQELTTAAVQQKVKDYNTQINSNLFMNMVNIDYWSALVQTCSLQERLHFQFECFCCWQNKDGSYTGFVKVQFKLARPVSVHSAKKGSHDGGGKKGAGVKRRTSFYLPKDASKHLHISSRTSAREVIEALLKKFTVVDNPGKFALFERSERHDQGS